MNTKELFEQGTGIDWQQRQVTATSRQEEVEVYRRIGESLGTRQPIKIIENDGYKLEIYGVESDLGKFLRVFRIEPNTATKPMRLTDPNSTRTRFLVSGEAGILRQRGGMVSFINLGDGGIALPEEIIPGDVACLIAGKEGAVVIDSTDEKFNPMTMEVKVEENDQEVLEKFWRIRK